MIPTCRLSWSAVVNLGAGYFYVLRSPAWTITALCTAALQGRRVRLATLLGPLVVTGGVAGQAVVVVEGSLVLLGGFAVLTGVGFGAAAASVVANAAGLAAGVSPSIVAAVATWVYGLSVVAPATIAVLTLRVLWSHQPVWLPFGNGSSKASNGA